jgi:5-formyltetrahydrofolate cyclo-ligase
MNNRQQLRKQLRAKRRALSPQHQKNASRCLLRTLHKRLDFLRARHIALYLPNDGEIDPTPVIRHCWQRGKKVYLPVLHPIRHNRLWFVPYTPSSKMVGTSTEFANR